MNLSYIAMDRISEEGLKNHPEWKIVARTDRPRMSLGRTLSDEQLLEKLHRWGIEFTGDSFKKTAAEHLSAEALTKWLHEDHSIESDDQQLDWIWVALAVLWERWLPEQPSIEMIDDRMQKGYKELENKNKIQACDDWLWSWNQIRAIAQKQDTHTVSEFDDFFGGTQSLFNWSQDFDMELGNAGAKEPRFLNERIRFAEEFVGQFTDHYFVQMFADSAAETYFIIGQKEKADRLFEEALAINPKWGWGWIHWSDCYRWHSDPPLLEQAESILRRGLKVSGVEDREYLLERIMDVLSEMGRAGEAEALRWALESAQREGKAARSATGIPPAPGGHPKATTKVGRNDPCPCGSGKKFKKCCLH